MGFDYAANVKPETTTRYLGLDAGGTRTRAVLVLGDGTVAGVGFGGSANPNNLGFDEAVRQLHTAAEVAWRAAGLPMVPSSACFIGAAGIKSVGDCTRLGEAAAHAGLAPLDRCVAANDTEAALAGGLPGRPGIALIAGTGSFCLGRDRRGCTARCGGWGWLLDDVGSGFYLGREALRAVAQAGDGRAEPTALTPEVFARFQLREIDDLLAAVYTPPPTAASVAELAPLVLRVATAGDPVACGILREGAGGLAQLVQRVASALAWERPPEVVLVGGVARSGPPYQPMIETAIASAVAGARVVGPAMPPIAGAALRALELGGVSITDAVLTRLQAGLAGHALG